MLAQGVFRRFQFTTLRAAGDLKRLLPVLWIESADLNQLYYLTQLVFGRGSGAAGSDSQQERFQQLVGERKWKQ